MLCTVLQVVNGKSFGLRHHSNDMEWEGIEGIHGGFRNERLLDVRMLCPSGEKYTNGRCRKIM